MAQLTFQIPYTSREGHCPDVGGWTYHHILPVRYYWCAAFIMLKLIRLQYCQGQGIDKIKTFTQEFGKEASGFDGDIATKSDIIASIMSLHHAGGNNVRPGLAADQSNPENMAAIARECTGPRYGGFAGMNGSSQRTDDPGSRIEKKRPLSFPEEKWALVQEVGNILTRCVANITTGENGPYACTVNEKNATGLLHCLRTLRTEWPGICLFNCTDWKTTAGKNGWRYLTNPGVANTTPRQGQCGNIFSLVSAAQEAGVGVAVSRDDLANLPAYNPFPQGVVKITRSAAADDKLCFF